VEFIKDAKAVAPDKPFFCTTRRCRACSAPRLKGMADKFKGRFDMGTKRCGADAAGRRDGHRPGRRRMPP